MLIKIIRLFYFGILILFTHNLLGQEYFQQQVDYTIQVTLNDQKHLLSGFEEIQYTNNAPDKLSILYFHLWPNAYRSNETALAKELFELEGKHHLFKASSQRGLIDSLNFKVNGQKIEWEYDPQHPDICKLILNEPLNPAETITITTPFRVKIPLAVTSRMGHYGQSYKITQWYPKPAVYDHNGWHTMPYLDMAEFYAEFGSFDVSVTLPENYVVAATGELQNEKEIAWLNQKAKETKRRYQFDETDMSFPPSSGQQKTVRYTIDQAHDFAWFADKRYHVLKDSVKLKNSGKKVYTWAFFTNEQAKMWQQAPDYMTKALQYFSSWYGEYPYKNCSAVMVPSESTGGGMEYPGITVIDRSASAVQLEEVLAHEIAHNWFYGMLGFNERRYPFLDEGLATLTEARYMNKEHPDLKLFEYFGFGEGFAGFLGFHHLNYAVFNNYLYLLKARKNQDQPTSSHSTQFSPSNYLAIAYAKSGKAFQYLMHYLGKEQFDAIMQDFIQEWKFRHPSPEDLHQFFEEKTGKNLDWFFHDLMKTTKKIDYSVRKWKGNQVLLKNKGEIASPVLLSGSKYDKTIYSKWYEGFSNEKWLELPREGADKISIDPPYNMLELYRHNNHMKKTALFKKTEPLKLQFGGLVNNPQYTQIHYLPAIAWNYYDKSMFGMLFYDAPIPHDHFDYYLVPTYSTGNNSFAGTGSISLQTYPNHFFQRVQLGLSGKRFSISDVYEGQYNKVKGSLRFDFGKDHGTTPPNQLTISAIHATDIKDIANRIENGSDNTFSYNTYLQATFSHNQLQKSINPYRFSINLEGSGEFIKTWLEAQYKLSYYMDEGLTIRLFGGTFLDKSPDLDWNYALNLSGESGFQDYTYENTYLGRFEPPLYENAIRLFAQQFYPTEGAFALYTPLGVTKEWLATLNLKTSLPLIEEIPIHAYANFGVFGETRDIPIVLPQNNWALESGFTFSFLNFVDIYFPVIASQNLEKASNYYSKRYGEKIRFHIRFNLLDPSTIMDNLSF